MTTQAETSSTIYLDTIRKSGLLKTEALESYIDHLRQDGDWPDDALGQARKMLAQGKVTKYQAEQLLQGRWRNFQIGGKFNVLERLSNGTMSSVFLCEHALMKRMVALKFLPDQNTEPSVLARFHREARAAARLQHPNVVAIYDVDCVGKLHFLVTEFVDGGNLESVVKLTGPMTVERAAHYISQAAEGLQHAHENGMVHRDIKPSNFLLDRSGTVKLLDLGLARLFQDETDGMTQLENGRILLGTIDYLAPEQAVDSHHVDIRADIYGLGATFFFLLTGRTLYEGVSSAQKLAMHSNSSAKSTIYGVPGISKSLSKVLEKMLAKNPASRYQTPAEVVEALAAFVQEPIDSPSDAEMPRHCLATRRALEQTKSGATRNGRAETPAPKPSRPNSTPRYSLPPKAPSRIAPASQVLPRIGGSLKFPKHRVGFPMQASAAKLWIGGGALLATVVLLGLFLSSTGEKSKADSVSIPNQAVNPPARELASNEADSNPQPPIAEPLKKRGAFKPIDLQPSASVITTRGMFFSPDSTEERLIFPDWTPKTFEGVPFHLIDPQLDTVPNAIMLFGPFGDNAPKMPRSVSLECHAPAKVIHFLSGISGWGANDSSRFSNLEKTVSMIVRLHYDDGQVEDHPLRNNVHFADYIRVYDVPDSKLAFRLGESNEHQLRYLTVSPRKSSAIRTIELVKGPDNTAPIVMAVTVEGYN